MALKIERGRVRLTVGTNYRLGFFLKLWADRRGQHAIAPAYLESEDRDGDWVPVVHYSLGGVPSHEESAEVVRQGLGLRDSLKLVLTDGGTFEFGHSDEVSLTILRTEGRLALPYAILARLPDGKGHLAFSLTIGELQEIYKRLVEYFELEHLDAPEPVDLSPRPRPVRQNQAY